MAFQPDLPFFASDSGYAQWRDEILRHRAELERRLGIPIGARVSVVLADFDQPFVGVLEIVIGTREENPRLRLRDLRFDFGMEEIVSISRVE